MSAVDQFHAVREALEKNPKLLPEALAFYRSCALDERILFAVRANCLFHFKRLSHRIDDTEFPAELSAIVAKLPPG